MKIRKLKAFTLVELIVVMVILAILAGLLIPSLTKYIDKANSQDIVVRAREIYTAAQAGLSDAYGTDTFFKTQQTYYKFKIDGKTEKRGFITNFALFQAQQKLFKGDDIGELDTYNLAGKILFYLESDKKDSAVYVFKNKTAPTTGIKVDDFVNKYKNPGVIICFDSHGLVDFVQYGENGYLVTIKDGNIYVNKNGTFVKYNSGNKNSVQTYFTFEDD